MAPRVAVLSSLMIFVACSGDPGEAVGILVRDSAGVQVVECTDPAWSRGDAWTVPNTPILEIGAVEGDPDYLFGGVTTAVRQANGQILVADAQANLIRVYDEGGVFLTSWGREGEGPGEFTQLQWLWQTSGDSILATEFIRAPSLFTSEGQFVRRSDFQLADWAQVTSQQYRRSNLGADIVGHFDDGTLIARLAGVVRNQEGLQSERIGVLRYDKSSGTGDTILVTTGRPRRVALVGGRLQVQRVTHFDPHAGFAIYGDRLVIGVGDSYSFNTHDRDGRLVRVFRLLRPMPAVTKNVRESHRENRSQYWGRVLEPGMQPGRLQQLYEATPFPDSLPSFFQLRTDALGNLWAEAWSTSDWDHPSREHLVFDSSGVFLGTVTMPHGVTVVQIGADFVLGVWKDETEVDFVRLYELRKE